MTPEQLKEIEKRANNATPGPWDYDEGMAPFYNDAAGNSCGGGGTGYYEVFTHLQIPDGWPEDEAWDDLLIIASQLNKGTAEFIAKAREDIPALVDEIRRLQEWLDYIANGGTDTALAVGGQDEVDKWHDLAWRYKSMAARALRGDTP